MSTDGRKQQNSKGESQGAHTTVVDRFVWLGLVQTQVCVISCRTSDRCSFRHIWQSPPPPLTRLYSTTREETSAAEKFENLSVYGRVRFRFVRMRFEQRNSAWIETESARSAAEVSSLVVLYSRVRGGSLSNMAEWAAIARPTRDNTNLGLNKP